MVCADQARESGLLFAGRTIEQLWLFIGGLVCTSTLDTVVVKDIGLYFASLALVDVVGAIAIAAETFGEVASILPHGVIQAEVTKEIETVQDWAVLEIFICFSA